MTRKRTLLLLALIAIIGAGFAALRWTERQRPRVFQARGTDGQTHTWRSMHAAWTFKPGIEGYHGSLSNLVCRDGRIYYACECEAGCLDAASGGIVWRRPFISCREVQRLCAANGPGGMLIGQTPTARIAIDGRTMYVAECKPEFAQDAPSYHVRAIEAASGAVRWDWLAPSAPLDAPRPAGDRLLVPLRNESIVALDRARGVTLWTRRVAKYNPSYGQEIGIAVRSDGRIAVAQVGAGRLVGLRASDGTVCWTRGESDPSGNSGGPLIRNGVVFALLSDQTLLALDEDTGRPLWRRGPAPSGNASAGLLVCGDTLVTRKGDCTVGVRIADAHTLWAAQDQPSWSNPQGPWTLHGRPSNRALQVSDAVAIAVREPPLIDDSPREMRSANGVTTLVVRDVHTGREMWRWQPFDGFGVAQVAADGDWLVVHDGRDICGIEEGDAPPIPTVPSARRQMAQRMIFALTGWSPARAPMQAAPRDVGVYRSRGEGPLDLLRRLRDRLSGSAVEEMESASQDEAAMTLLRLHGEGVRALMDYVALETAGKTDGFQLETALRLLYDTGDRTIYPTLIERLAASPSPLARRLLADALIESGEPSAVPALFRFAQSAAEDGVSRREALYRVCEPGAGGVPRDAVTRWLERSIADRRSPAWLRLFARFELLNDRGARARRIALAAFQGEPTASFALRGVVLKSPNGRFRISNVPPDPLVCKVDASARDRNGVLWCVVHWSYLGNDDDMWLARSTDGKHWTNLRYVMTDPVVTMDGYSQDTMKLRLTRGGIELVWPPLPNDATAKKRHSYVRSVSFADLDRDSDGDGLPDRLERAMGTDPYRRDTNGDGVSDERDKNPCYRRRPLTDEEGIYQAVMEGLCQAERFGSDGTKLGGPDAAVSLAERGQPIVLRGAARDCGLRIWGHYGPAVYLPLRSPADYAALSSYRSQYEFCAPMRDIEPQAKEDAPAAATDPFDTKLAPDPPPKAPQFADYFPVQRSKDGLRARVGFCQRGGRPLYDVEGRKIDGVWYPVQCRLVQAPGRQFINWSGPDAELVVPLRRPKP